MTTPVHKSKKKNLLVYNSYSLLKIILCEEQTKVEVIFKLKLWSVSHTKLTSGFRSLERKHTYHMGHFYCFVLGLLEDEKMHNDIILFVGELTFEVIHW